MVRVVARQPLARTASLAVVEVGDRVLVVGVSENGVSLLTEMDPSELPAEMPAELPAELAAAESAVVSPGARRASPTPGLAGSVLSTQTWREAWAVATGRNGGSGD
jgi:flagellar protein FliO/FliZ